MAAPEAIAAASVAWSVACRPLVAYTRSGDHYVVAEFAGGVLLAAIDGLGHGDDAADAATLAAAVLRERAGTALIPLVHRCHEDLRGTRGVVLSVAAIDLATATMTWMGVGNVEGVLFRADGAADPAREGVLPRAGVLGYQLPPLRARAIAIGPGDTLIFATDGIRSEFVSEAPDDHTVGELAEEILVRFGRESDDALVLVARYLGPPPS